MFIKRLLLLSISSLIIIAGIQFLWNDIEQALSHIIFDVETGIQSHDEKHYGGTCKYTNIYNSSMYDEEITFITDGNEARNNHFLKAGSYRARMPFVPFIHGLFNANKTSTLDSIIQAKRLLIIIYIAVMLFLYLIWRHLFNTPIAIGLTLVSFVDLRPFLKGDSILFYLIFLLMFLNMIYFLNKPSLPLAISGGISLTLAYLIKGSAPLALYIFTCFFVLSQIRTFVTKRKDLSLKTALSLYKKPVALYITYIGLFFIIMSPYLIENKTVYGKIFFNVSTSIYIWLDDWSAVVSSPFVFVTPQTWEWQQHLPIPNAKTYLKTHSIKDIYARWKNGFTKNTTDLLKTTLFNALFGSPFKWATLVFFFWFITRHLKTLFSYKLELSFSITFFTIYYLAYNFYVPIGGSQRFITSLYLIFLTGIGYILQLCLYPNISNDNNNV